MLAEVHAIGKEPCIFWWSIRMWVALGESLNFVQGRNRRCITVDMRTEKGRQIIKRLAENVDVLVENFRPGVMEKWGLGPKAKLPLI